VNVLPELIGNSPEIVAVRERVQHLLQAWSRSRRPPPTLIQGGTGTGKGLLARALHPLSPRAEGPFVDLNCAAIPETLLEAELFGYERGAFTDARQAKPGLFQLAHRGTLFLDEIGLLPLALQAKLLSVLEERSVRRLGATRAEPADVWVIAATNEDLMQAMRERRFREDLYHRIAVVTITLPPLSARGDDALLLAEHFLARACAEYGLPPRTLADDARRAIASYEWPGNVRELSNALERAAMLSTTSEMTAADLALGEGRAVTDAAIEVTAAPAVGQSSRDLLREQLSRVLTETDWNISRTATTLGVSRNTVTARIARFGLRGPRKAGAEPPADAEPAPADVVASRSAAPKIARWETRRLTFLRLEVDESADTALEGRTPAQLDVAVEKLRGFGGRIEGLGKRVLLASFGIEPSDEHALLAAHSALVIQHAARDMARETGSGPVRIGLHTAESPVRVGAGAASIDPDAGRAAWNVIDAAMAGTDPFSITATAPAAALLRRRFALSLLEERNRTHQLHGLWRNDDTNVRGQRGMFAGRRPELALLQGRFAEAAQGQGQVVAVTGEVGIGKSRVLLELVASPQLEGAQFFEGYCVPGEVQVPFLPLLQIVKAICGVVETDGAHEIAQKVNDALADGGSHAADAVAALTYLLGASTSAPEPPSAVLKKRLFAAVQKLLFIKSAAAPILLLIEDIQWIDPTSEACLGALVESLGGAPILLAVTYRTGYRPAWAAASKVLRLTLSPLSPEDSLAIIRGVLHGGTCSPEVEQKIQAWAEGNPLFLEELSRTALERGDAPLGERIPATIEDTIETRLAGLPWRLRRLLSAAAVIGREVPLPLLREVADLPTDALDAAAGQLETADFLYRSEFGMGEPRCTFKHALVQQTAYAKLGPSECRALHLRALDAIEKLYPDKSADQPERLAHHAMLAEVYDRAIRYLLQAGRKAARRFGLVEALSQLNKGLDLLPKLRDDRERDRWELGLRISFAMVLSLSKGPAAPETAQALARAVELERRVPDYPELGTLLVGQWYGHLLRAEYSAANEVASRLHALGEDSSDPAVRAVGHLALGMTALYFGDFASVQYHLERALELYRTDEHHHRILTDFGWPIDRTQHVNCFAYLGRALWCLGYPDQALARNREALARARDWGGGALNVAIALGMLTTAHQMRREIAEARETSEQAIAHTTEWGISYWLAFARMLRSATLQGQGFEAEAGDAVREIQRSLSRYRATGTLLGVTWFLTMLADAHRANGQTLEGLGAAEEALGLAEARGERYYEAEAHRIKGALLLQRGADAEPGAEACFRKAIEIAQHQQAKGWELRAATDLARLLYAQKRVQEARDVLAPAYAWFTEGFDLVDLREARALLDALHADD
jgi:DNA-binding NtrC family response regulator/predicted ATPase